jgi:transposase
MDDFACHERAGVRRAIGGRGEGAAVAPSYGPEFNPIEMAFARLKALLRKVGERTVDGLWRLLGRLLDEFTPRECRNFMANCGYSARST